MEMYKWTEERLKEDCQSLKQNLVEKDKELEQVKAESASSKQFVSDNTVLSSQLLTGVINGVKQLVKQTPTQTQVKWNTNNESLWDKDFLEIQDRLSEEEQLYVQNAILSAEDKIGFIDKYLNYRKVDYLSATNRDISGLKKNFSEKITRTQKYISHLKRENQNLIRNYQMENQSLYEDYNGLQQQHAEEVEEYKDTINKIQEENESMKNQFNLFKTVHRKLVDSYKKLQEAKGTMENSKDIAIVSTSQVKNFKDQKYYKHFAAPFAQSENEKILKTQVDNLMNSKVANEKVKKDLKKEISKLKEENEELRIKCLETQNKDLLQHLEGPKQEKLNEDLLFSRDQFEENEQPTDAQYGLYS